MSSSAPRILEAPEKNVLATLAKIRRERDELWAKLPMFDLAKARAGVPYFHLFDFPQLVAYSDVRRIDGPHSGYLVWAGEWLVYGDDDQALEEMESHFRMADLNVVLRAALAKVEQELAAGGAR